MSELDLFDRAMSGRNLWSPREPRRRTSVLFVCLGNICRSPLAKAIFEDRARARNVLDRFHIDSCGTGHWHVGRPADARSIAIAAVRGTSLTSTSHRARQVDADSDFDAFDLILAMDQSNASNLIALGAPSQRVVLLRAFDPALAADAAQGRAHAIEVPDPYYGGDDGFARMHDMLDAACDGLLDRFDRAWKA